MNHEQHCEWHGPYGTEECEACRDWQEASMADALACYYPGASNREQIERECGEAGRPSPFTHLPVLR